MNINWEAGHANNQWYYFCKTHYDQVMPIFFCTLCTKRLVKGKNFPLRLMPKVIEEVNQKLQGFGIPSAMLHSLLVCKLCRYFINLHVTYDTVESMPENKQVFHRNYRIQ